MSLLRTYVNIYKHTCINAHKYIIQWLRNSTFAGKLCIIYTQEFKERNKISYIEL